MREPSENPSLGSKDRRWREEEEEEEEEEGRQTWRGGGRERKRKRRFGSPSSLRLKNVTGRGGTVMKNQHDFVWFTLLFLSMCPKFTSAQGHFPRMENVAAFKPVSTSPSRSSCGFPERSSYCRPPAAMTEPPVAMTTLTSCLQDFCVQECPFRSSTSPYAPLLLLPPPGNRTSCVTEDREDTRPGTGTRTRTRTRSEGVSGGSSSVRFHPDQDQDQDQDQDGCFLTPSSQTLGALGSLALALWIKTSAPGEMMLLEKTSAENSLVFSLSVSDQSFTLSYRHSSSHSLHSVVFRTDGRITPDTWTHLVLQVHDRRVSAFVDGLEEDGTPFDTQSLTSRLSDGSEDDAMWVGRSSNGSLQFIGRMQDFRFYPQTLTNREIVEIYSGFLPKLHSQSECRCPPSHPRVHPLVQRYCIPNGVEDTTNHRVLRLHSNAHPLSYINDRDMGTTWISRTLTTQDLDRGLTVTVDLLNGQYQIFHVIVQFSGFLPDSVLIQRQRLDLTEPEGGPPTERPWLDWQYLARNCSVFDMTNDGPLAGPDSVNCVQLPSDVSGGNVTFSLLTPKPNARPGYNDFYNTPALQSMAHATQVRVHLRGQSHNASARVDPRHRYYAVREITISGRCECHGHADHCDTSVTPYRCICLPESHTEGNNCDRCASLYNDKPFRAGDQLQPMNCRSCRCHGHATSCHYEVGEDEQPEEHYRGGGGVCDQCMHNTTGKHCDLCSPGFFRLDESDPESVDVCRPCSCNAAGTVNSSTECEQVGGQCGCKSAVTGRRCSECRPGWFGLTSSNPDGCRRCNCSQFGVAVSTGRPGCDQNTGQCHCKPHVTGPLCDGCEFGFWNLSHPSGCVPCGCDPVGSLSPFCEAGGGQCECRPGVGGRACDVCSGGAYGLRVGGACESCDCSEEGTEPGTECDPHSGQCVCKEHVEGRRCDACRRGYHSLDRRNSLGCLQCLCDAVGTTPGAACHADTGQCPCRAGVEGARCNSCSHNYYNKTAHAHDGSTYGCAPCVCDVRGTVSGSVCDVTTGQCVCVPTRYGKDCSSCRPGWYLSSDHSVCSDCDCHPMGALQPGCESHTGQCVCGHPSVGGRRCDQCRDLYYGFNPGLGRCRPCGCDPSGSVNGSCDPDSGQCVCKLLVAGIKCDECQPGATNFDPDNYYGCSKAPSQQPPPAGFPLSSSSILLTWSPPDSPNSHRLNYTLLRDGDHVHTVQRLHPHGTESFLDEGLSPFTSYSYRLLTANVAGETVSSWASYRTLSSPPDPEQLRLNLVGRAGARTASFSWSSPRNHTGPVERFILSSVESGADEPVVHYTGSSTETVVSDLKPFTQYTVTLEACTSGGCSSSPPLSLLTGSAPPQDQAPPTVTATGPHSLHASWDPPSQPNGVITRYELFLRGPLDQENRDVPPERRVFSSVGWLDLSVSPQQTNVSSVTPPENRTEVKGLQPFSSYQLRVVSINAAGSVTSGWTTTSTEEGVPELMSPPEVSPLTSTSLKVTWSSAQGPGVIARGHVTEFRVNLLTEQKNNNNNTHNAPVLSQVLQRVSPSSPSVFVVKDLKPFSVYNFTVTLCTRKGCVSSSHTSGRTLPADPAGLSPPRLLPVNESTININWDPPDQLNGPNPLYQVERTDVSLSDPTAPVVRGTRFSGNGFYQFPNDTLPVNTDFTGIALSFRTRSADGLLLAAFAPGNQDEFVAVQLRDGRPYFLFDPQGSVVCVRVQGDGGRRYDDGRWHSVMATRRGAVGTIIVDDQYRGSSSASSGSSIIGENTGLFVGGIPEDFTLLREDSGDAALVKQGFSGCLRDVSIKTSDVPSEKWTTLDWTKTTRAESVYESWEGCPAHSQDGVHFLGHGHLETVPGVFSGGENFEIFMNFRTDQFNALLLFTYNTQNHDYMLVSLEGGLLTFALSAGGHVTELSMWAGLSYCDGDWKSLSLAKRGSLISAAVSDWSEEARGRGGAAALTVDSPLYLGGVASEVRHPALKGHTHGLGGCVRSLRIRSDGSHGGERLNVDLSSSSRGSVRVFLDGCPDAASRFHCRGNDSVLVFSGRTRNATDHNLQAFTEYLYRVVAVSAGGWAAGPWQRTRSRTKAPSFVAAPSSVRSLDGFTAAVTWTPPTDDIRGLIDSYELKAYNRDRPEESPVSAVFLANGELTGLLSGLTPSTRYSVTVSACSPAGCTESLHHNITTPEEAPDGVSPPAADSAPSALYLTWDAPARPNGVITEYLVYHNHHVAYRGTQRLHNITGLGVYSTHVLLLSVCTAVGCTNSSKVTALTSQLPPGPLAAPDLTLLDSRSVLVEWSRPSQVNGVLESYAVFLSRDGSLPVVVYNSSELSEDVTLRDLTPGTAYTVTIAACTGGGCTLSPSSSTHTEEGSPENVPAPLVTPLSPHALNVSWTPPDTPNGVITSYGLWMDGALVFNTSSSLWFYVVEGLGAWSRHVLRLQACTARGCGRGPMVEVRTLQAVPEGPILLELTNQSSRSLRARWTAPPRPNGNLNYTLHYKNTAGDGDDVLGVSVGPVAGVWLSVSDLRPHTSYTFWVRGCNARGCVESLSINVTTPPAAPDGLSPPWSSHVTRFSLNVSWSSPVHANAAGPLRYSLQMRTSPHKPVVRLVDNETDVFSHYVDGLTPYGHFLFRVIASHTHGHTASAWTTLHTAEDSPGPVDSLSVSGLRPRSVTLSWRPPSQPNGVITNYTLHLCPASDSSWCRNRSTAAAAAAYITPGHDITARSGSVSSAVTGNNHHSNQVQGSNLDQDQIQSTSERNQTSIPNHYPEFIATSSSAEPDSAHQPVGGDSSFVSVTVPGNVTSFTFQDLQPFQTYSVQVESCTRVGCSVSGSLDLRTPPAPPEGVPAPFLYSDSPTSVLLSWGAPQRSNGDLERWLIERRLSGTDPVSTVGVVPPAPPPLSFLDWSSALSPWTRYQYRLVLHNQAGNTSGPWVNITTRPSRPAGLSPPRVKVLGPDSLQVWWSPPLLPNGEILSYELRLPESFAVDGVSELSVAVGDLTAFTNYSVSVVACSGGGGHVGGCTESLPSPATTLPTIPRGVDPLSVVTLSESALAVSWQPPRRPNGPNVRYKLLRRKTHQPLLLAAAAAGPPAVPPAPPPDPDLHRWLRVYSGTKLFHQDKGLSRFTRYQYQLEVHNDVGFSSGEVVTAVTMGGVPRKPPTLFARAVNHTAVEVIWTPPGLQDLQGEVVTSSLLVSSSRSTQVLVFPPETRSTLVQDLWPSTEYLLAVRVSNGAHNTTWTNVSVTTKDGVPEGMSPPEVVPVNSSSARVLWFPPSRPNGLVTAYNVYVNERLLGRVDNHSESYLLVDLQPFTVYNVQVEVCTVYACVRSNITQTTTVEDSPSQLAAPHAHVIGPRQVKLVWSPPGRPAGIMLGYQVFRQTLRSCAAGSSGSGGVRFRCSYLQCPAGHGVCGTSCFSPDHQVCCSGVVYTRKLLHRCCEDRYMTLRNSSSSVCCNGKLIPVQPEHQCCGGHYVHLETNQHCCPDPGQGRVSVGRGDSCCGGAPYAATGGQICCGRSLHDGYGAQCCGGRVVDDTKVCCGDADEGKVHEFTTGFVCCGLDYINSSSSLCCVGSDGFPTMHPAGNATVTLQCCGSKVIHQDEECCNGIGYDPKRHVCADKPTPGLDIQESVYSGDANTFTFTDSGLAPFTSYSYFLSGWNGFGRGFSDVTAVTTNEERPWGVAPPLWGRLGDRDDIITLRWHPPARPNGVITHYVILRDGQERYRGDELSFVDVGGVRAFQEYRYRLRVCNRAGCSDSQQVVAVTVRGVPQGVRPPVVTALNSTSLHVSWSEPTRPNGNIQRYVLNRTTGTEFSTDGTGPRNYTVTGLRPFSVSSFVLSVCSSAGCESSSTSTGRTLQAAPAGVWSRPRHLVVSPRAVDLFWDQPDQPNGLVSRFTLIRDGVPVFTGDQQDQNYTDSGLDPDSSYEYQLEAETGGGVGVSDKYVIRTPSSCPTGIKPPDSVTVLGPDAVTVAWSPPTELDVRLPVTYNILLNPGSDVAVVHPAGSELNVTVRDLEPFTSYYIRVQACQSGGCGAGGGVYTQTLEAPPEGLAPPTIKPAGARILEVHWAPPKKPNGLITAYHVYRRPAGSDQDLLVFLWSSGPLVFLDASPDLRPFTSYQYRLRCSNSRGSALSVWASAWTLQALPLDLAPPTVTPTGAFSAHLIWSEPVQPNGVISVYKVIYKKQPRDPTMTATPATALTTQGSVLEAEVFGLEPFTDYSLQVQAVNQAGGVSSAWVSVRTLESSPCGVLNFTVEQRERGRALLLTWDQPRAPNGVITSYGVYIEGNLEFSGLSRNFLFRRLEPWTMYTLILEACTAAGCARSQPQPVTTAAAPPSSQPPPRAVHVGPDRVTLTWGPPARPNGPLGEYALLGRREEHQEHQEHQEDQEDQGGARSDEEEEEEEELVLFTASPVQDWDSVSHTVLGLRPWTRYRFRVRALNPAGAALSPWVTVSTRPAPPGGLAPPTLSHVQGRPRQVLVSWSGPREPNGVLQSYRVQRNNQSLAFTFDPTVLSYTDHDLMTFTSYSYAITACTSEGCITSSETTIRTLESPPAAVAPPTADVTSSSMSVFWSKPPTQSGLVTEFLLKLNEEEVYGGANQSTELTELQPHTSYRLQLVACSTGGCTASITVSIATREAPPTGMQPPTLKVTGPESVEVTWTPPDDPNGVITGYELRRDGDVIYVGNETRYHDFTLLPSVEYGYTVRAKNREGTTSSQQTTARTHPAAPSGVAPPRVTPQGPGQVRVEWTRPARPNGDIVSYTVSHRDPVQLSITSTEFTPKDEDFTERHTTLSGLDPHHRYEVRVEACTSLGCSSSDWSSVLTPDAPPAGQAAPLLELQRDPQTGLQTHFLLTWTPPARPNGRILHYELYRRLDHDTQDSAETLVYRNVSTSCRDQQLQPYTVYQYQVLAVNSAGRCSSPWTNGRTGPAPPDGVAAPAFLRVSATSALVEVQPPARANGVVALYRVFSVGNHDNQDNRTTLSEGTTLQQTLHGLRPYTQYWVGVEACTCYQCCSRGPVSELHTLPAPPTHQPPPRPLTMTSRSVQLVWDQPLEPNGVIESCELHVRSSCPQPPQPVPRPCTQGPIEICFFGRRRSYNVTGLQPYSSYQLRVSCFNNVGSITSNWTSVSTLSEAPQYVSVFTVDSNLTVIWLNWTSSFSLNGVLKEFSVTESELRVYSGFSSIVHVARTSQRTLSFQVTCTTASGSASSPTVRYSPATGIDSGLDSGLDSEVDSGPDSVSVSAAPVYSELWFILLVALLGLFLLALLLGLLLQRALRKNPSARELPPLVTLQRSSKTAREAYMRPGPQRVSRSVLQPDPHTGLTDTRVGSGSGSRFRSMEVVRVPGQLDQAFSQHALHRSVSQLMEPKSLMMEGNWEDAAGHDSGLLVDDEEFVDAIKALKCVKKEQKIFTDTHL